MQAKYSKEFYSNIEDWSSASARVIAPLMMDLIHPQSVIDVGCGDGTWLKYFQEHGVKEIFGLDGEHIAPDVLKINPSQFMQCDLTSPPEIQQKFDLAVCLEVAEHIPAASADGLAAFLCSLSDVILFSAAVPYQSGQHHVNTQWPEYWVGLFEKNGFSVINSIKYRLWNNPEVAYFYKQNSLLFVNSSKLANSGRLREEMAMYAALPLTIIHPQLLKNIGRQNEEYKALFNHGTLGLFFSRLRNKLSKIKQRAK